MPRKTKEQERFELLYSTIDELKEMVKDISDVGRKEREDIRLELAKRSHKDTLVDDHEIILRGNGKPGFIQIRDIVMGWKKSWNTVTIAVIIDIILNLVRVSQNLNL